MSYSAKSLLSKAKEIQEFENAKREAELKAQKEQRKIDAQRKKFNQNFINEIGIRCVEKALENEAYCLISDTELDNYKELIKACGLNVEQLKLTTEDIKLNHPELYEELQIEAKLDAILDQLDDLNESNDFIDENSHLLDQELAEYNNELYEIYETMLGDDWHLTLIEKTITEEIEYSGIKPSIYYDDDDEMYMAVYAILEILKKYKEKGIRNIESDMVSDATFSIRQLISEIPSISRVLKEHKSKLSKLKENKTRDKAHKESQIEKLLIARENLLSKYHQINIISWDTGDKVSPENSFLNPENLRWIMDHP